MIARRALIALSVSALAAALMTAAVPAGADTKWVQKKVGETSSAWVPNAGWQVSGTAQGIDVSSPTGDEGASLAWTRVPGFPSPSQIAHGTLEALATSGFEDARLVFSGAPAQSASGQRQRFAWTATHRWVNGTQNVRGDLYVETVQGTGFSVGLVYAPSAKYKTELATLDNIRRHIVVYK